MIHLNLDVHGDGKKYDKVLRGFMPDKEGDLHIVSKSNGTKAGRPIVMLVHRVILPNGQPAAARVFLTAREFMSAAFAVLGAHPGCGDRDDPALLNGVQPIHRQHRGVGWNAVVMEKVLLINVEGNNGISIAGSPEEAEMIAKTMIDRMLG